MNQSLAKLNNKINTQGQPQNISSLGAKLNACYIFTHSQQHNIILIEIR